MEIHDEERCPCERCTLHRVEHKLDILLAASVDAAKIAALSAQLKGGTQVLAAAVASASPAS